MKRLNWKGWAFTMVIIMLAAIANKSVNSFVDWAAIVIIFGLPLSLFPLILGRKERKKRVK